MGTGLSFPHAILAGLTACAVACAQGATSTDEDLAARSSSGAGGAAAVCGDAVCAASEGCASCPDDCACDSCGDQVCGLEEACDTCEADCGPCSADCGNGFCDAGETQQSCPQDCQVGTTNCGDGYCDPPETEQTCPQDCGGGGVMCGDSYCDPPETAQTCPSDCQQGGNCTHSPCDEGDALDPLCDPCAGIVCQFDPYCCSTAWDGQCVSEAAFICGCP